MRDLSVPFLIAGSLVLAGCAQTTKASRQGAESDPDQAITTAFQALESGRADYRITPQDLLGVEVYKEEDLHRDVRVSESGKVNLPLIGEVELAGLTVVQAETRLRDQLKDYLIEPYVSVTVREYHARRVMILGEVMRPGAYDIPPGRDMTVVEAIALAGGFTKIAAEDRTRVVRRSGEGVENLTVPVKLITSGDKTKDIALRPDDVVIVPQTFF